MALSVRPGRAPITARHGQFVKRSSHVGRIGHHPWSMHICTGLRNSIYIQSEYVPELLHIKIHENCNKRCVHSSVETLITK